METQRKKRITSSLGFKMIMIGVLILILLIPVEFIKDSIIDRESTRDNAIGEVSSKHGSRQTLKGPIITIPYKVVTHIENEKGVLIQSETLEYAHFLPEILNIEGEIFSEHRHRGIYEMLLYNSNLDVEGYFSAPTFEKWEIAENDILWDKAIFSFGISDLKGVHGKMVLNFNGKSYKFKPGVETDHIIYSGVSVLIPIDKSERYNFKFSLNLNGSRELNFIPAGKITSVALVSAWQNPMFNGNFLPITRKVDDEGFSAKWEITEFNRNYPQQWLNNNFTRRLLNSSFGVKLLFGVNTYQKTMRSVKYAILFIFLTFLAFFFVEIINKQKIHPIQYLLVGFALTLFYLLLLSLSEHMPFHFAYFVASLGMILLISFYSKSILKKNKLAIIIGISLTVIYSYLYLILQLQDYALLGGSIGLFVILALIMYLSRKVNWYS